MYLQFCIDTPLQWQLTVVHYNVMKNFEIRQTARDEEIEALKQAKAILSGAKFEAFLQAA